MLINEVFEATTNSTAVEDNIMSQFTVLKKQTNKDGYMSSIFILHHITKEATSKFNKEEGYRPRMSMLKGTTRVIDLSLIHISEPTRLLSISYAVFCLKKQQTQ